MFVKVHSQIDIQSSCIPLYCDGIIYHRPVTTDPLNVPIRSNCSLKARLESFGLHFTHF